VIVSGTEYDNLAKSIFDPLCNWRDCSMEFFRVHQVSALAESLIEQVGFAPGIWNHEMLIGLTMEIKGEKEKIGDR